MLVLALALAVSGAPGVTAQDAVSAGQKLYASASYEEALAAFSRIQESELGAADLQALGEYRMFCLVALGRTAEAESAAASLVSTDPLLHLDARAVSPRIAAMFEEVRKRMLPGIMQDGLRDARSALDRKDFRAAETQLTTLKLILGEREVSDQSLAGLRGLVEEFVDLVRSSLSARSGEPASELAGPRAVPTAGPDAGTIPEAGTRRTYSAADRGVVPPVPLHGSVIAAPAQLSALSAGATPTLDIVIDERGRVEKAELRETINPQLDGIVLNAVRRWAYRPATKDGVPVKYHQTLTITIKP
jgi:TonB family protein